MADPMSMHGKNVIITGAASGIGRETALLVDELGARTLLLDRDGAGCAAAAARCSQTSIAIECDLCDPQECKRAFDEGRTQLGKFHCLVHCAGVPSVVPLRSLATEEYERVQAINTRAGVFLTKLFADRKYRDPEAMCSIVYLSSVYGTVGSAGNIAYAVSKAAVIGMTKSLAIELAPKRIRVNCIAPGFIRTAMADGVSSMFGADHAERIESMHPLGWGDAIDIANGIAFLLSDASRWTTGAVLAIDGGFTAQ